MSDDELGGLIALVFILIGCVVGLVVFLLPTLIAFRRDHHYKWIICVINVFGSSALGVGWLVALIWSVWPRQTGVADVVLNDPTTNSSTANKEIYGRYNENISAITSVPEGTPSASFCSNCGSPVGAGAFCSNCGHRNS